jgi:hypothetical protein
VSKNSKKKKKEMTRRVLSAVTWFLSLLGIFSVVYGIWLALTIASKGA